MAVLRLRSGVYTSFRLGEELAIDGAALGAEFLFPRVHYGWPSLAQISVSFPVDIQSLLPAARSVAPSY
jgi:hypothetical protein